MNAPQTALPDVSVFRLHLLRVLYLVLAVGLGLAIWPSILFHDLVQARAPVVSHSLLAAIGGMALLGVRHPLRMLPLLVFEVFWKVIFLTSFALPLWWSGKTDADSWENIWPCLLVVPFVVILPWRYLVAAYVTSRGNRWR